MATKNNTTKSVTLSKKAVREYKAAFAAIDIDGDGRLTPKELRKMMFDIGEDITADEARAMVRAADADYSGTIEIDEFLMMMAHRSRPKSEEDVLADVFQQFDLNGDGVLSVDELRQAMRSYGEEMTKDEVRQMVKAADGNGDGVIDYKEFAKMMKS